MFLKSRMTNAYLPKISILLQFGGEILALLCPDDSIQILLILSQFLQLLEPFIQSIIIKHSLDSLQKVGLKRHMLGIDHPSFQSSSPTRNLPIFINLIYQELVTDAWICL